MTKIIEIIDDTGVKVFMNNQTTVVYLYNDEKGDYFMNHNLDKQYIIETEKINKI